MTANPPDVTSAQQVTTASAIDLDGGDGDTGIAVPRPAVAIIGLFLFLSVPLLLYILIVLWPVHSSAAQADTWSPDVYIFGAHITVPAEPRFIFLVVVAAAIGSFIAVATSFTTYLGNQRLYTRWLWWYILRLPIGIALSVLFYLAVRGGFFTSNATGADVNPFGVAALGGLVGMFSKQAADKLQDIFGQLFNSTRDSTRADKLI